MCSVCLTDGQPRRGDELDGKASSKFECDSCSGALPDGDHSTCSLCGGRGGIQRSQNAGGSIHLVCVASSPCLSFKDAKSPCRFPDRLCSQAKNCGTCFRADFRRETKQPTYRPCSYAGCAAPDAGERIQCGGCEAAIHVGCAVRADSLWHVAQEVSFGDPKDNRFTPEFICPASVRARTCPSHE